MFHPRPCGCKGQRTCLVCENNYGASTSHSSWISEEDREHSYVYCPLCELAWPGWATHSWKSHPNHEGDSIKIMDQNVISKNGVWCLKLPLVTRCSQNSFRAASIQLIFSRVFRLLSSVLLIIQRKGGLPLTLILMIVGYGVREFLLSAC
ncbi:hypothetical protein OTU49_004888 [Cherax quadricarinatus]|uniref:Uncharacterized protein n=1 Tax=Cherax quadricarinatus TaxID=27406 RepID=A0AAW0X9J3_CHEQU